MLATLFWLGLSYLLGSVPFGLLIAKGLCKVDPLSQGSGNIGATNIARTCGLGYGLLTLFLDMFKGWLPVFIAAQWSDSYTVLSLTAFAAVMGHMYSVFQHWKGGKGVATTIGVFLALAPSSLLWALVFFILVTLVSGHVSLGSLVLAILLPVFTLFSGHFSLFVLAVALMILIFWKHRENIERLRNGTEHSWKKNKHEEAACSDTSSL